mgnify:CR=1 FL=1
MLRSMRRKRICMSRVTGPLLASTGLVLLQFADLVESMEATKLILETEPSAIELMDRMLINLTRGQPLYASQISFIKGDPAALLAVAPDLTTFAALRVVQGLCMAAAFTLPPLVRWARAASIIARGSANSSPLRAAGHCSVPRTGSSWCAARRFGAAWLAWKLHKACDDNICADTEILPADV